MSSRRDRDSGSPDLGGERITPRYRPRQVEKTPPCQAACPNCGDIRGWIGLVAQAEKTGRPREEAYAEAWSRITERNPFPAVLGRICSHPCESACNRAEHDEALAINAMERFLGDWAIEQRLELPLEDRQECIESIGIVGAGPSGLSFAYQMARRGYDVTIYERRPEAGGMLRYGVPDYRLPRDVLQAEIDRILGLGVELHLATEIGRDVSLEELRQRHHTLYLGLGAQAGRPLRIPGEEGAGVLTGIDYLDRVNRGESIDIGENVLVVGGGNSAMDAARCARRQGAAVTVVYRRGRGEMPASEEEIGEALEEGIELLLQRAPVRMQRDGDGRLEGLVVQRVRLGEPDASGRRRPEPVADSEEPLRADTVIAAVSQAPVLAGFEALDHEGDWLLTHGAAELADDVLAGGDALGLGIAGNAIVQGRRAAEALHARLRGLPAPEPEPETEADCATVGFERIRLEHHPASQAAQVRRSEAGQRLAHAHDEVSSTISETQFLGEVERCFSCGSCFGCEQCAMYCTSGCFTRLEEPSPGLYFSLALDACKECGKCVEICPCGYLEVT